MIKSWLFEIFSYPYDPDPAKFDPALWMTPVGMIILGALAGLVPAFKAYRTDVASNLTPLS